MFSTQDISNIQLPDKTLCLTYDDGPGQYTQAIGEFLNAQGVRATFFVVGKYAVEYPEVLNKLSQLGHIIGNHTFEHPDMPIYVANDGDIRDQIIRTNTCIGKFNRNKITYFRAPYGKWSPEVANELNVSVDSAHKHCGPVHWDISGIDCYYWKLGKSVDETVQAYLDEIDQLGKGVIVMHDEIADMDIVKPLNKTLELTQVLIPLLKQKGYTFIGLDEIADRRLTEAAQDAFELVSPKGMALQYEDRAGAHLKWVSHSGKSNQTQLTIEDLGEGKVALKTISGLYLQVNSELDTLVTLSSEFTLSAEFHKIPSNQNQMYFRTYNGFYLGGKGENNELLKADAPFMLQALKLSYKPLTSAYLPPLKLSDKLRKIKKKILFIKSKLF